MPAAIDVKGILLLSGATSAAVGLVAPSVAGSTTYTLPSNDGTSGDALTTNGSGTLAWADVVREPGGSNAQVQFNDSGAFGGDAGLTYDKSTDALVIAGGLSAGSGPALQIVGSDGSATFSSSKQLRTFTFDSTNTTDDAATIIVEIDSSVVATSTSARFIRFTAGNGATEMGRILANNNAVAYATTSDERLKSFLGPTRYGLDTIQRIDVQDYNWKGDEGRMLRTGVSAQQLYGVYPEAVGVGSDDISMPWSVDYGKLTPPIIKAIQELSQRVQQLETELERHRHATTA